ncbi:hypothetical protein PsYK624_167890 [Phanerochaete sordida]|uniref:Uncharacterized protein n=1 Tax=Phanerochaete sordida TaxID=48140 RepID=A0A9P3GTK9_9APHY|nr:hypothetical protein PsYK624_167890 [Phanerochaete sordida]
MYASLWTAVSKLIQSTDERGTAPSGDNCSLRSCSEGPTQAARSETPSGSVAADRDSASLPPAHDQGSNQGGRDQSNLSVFRGDVDSPEHARQDVTPALNPLERAQSQRTCSAVTGAASSLPASAETPSATSDIGTPSTAPAIYDNLEIHETTVKEHAVPTWAPATTMGGEEEPQTTRGIDPLADFLSVTARTTRQPIPPGCTPRSSIFGGSSDVALGTAEFSIRGAIATVTECTPLLILSFIAGWLIFRKICQCIMALTTKLRTKSTVASEVRTVARAHALEVHLSGEIGAVAAATPTVVEAVVDVQPGDIQLPHFENSPQPTGAVPPLRRPVVENLSSCVSRCHLEPDEALDDDVSVPRPSVDDVPQPSGDEPQDLSSILGSCSNLEQPTEVVDKDEDVGLPRLGSLAQQSAGPPTQLEPVTENLEPCFDLGQPDDTLDVAMVTSAAPQPESGAPSGDITVDLPCSSVPSGIAVDSLATLHHPIDEALSTTLLVQNDDIVGRKTSPSIRTLPSFASPVPASPSLASPVPASPSLASPVPASPSPASPSPISPSSASAEPAESLHSSPSPSSSSSLPDDVNQIPVPTAPPGSETLAASMPDSPDASSLDPPGDSAVGASAEPIGVPVAGIEDSNHAPPMLLVNDLNDLSMDATTGKDASSSSTGAPTAESLRGVTSSEMSTESPEQLIDAPDSDATSAPVAAYNTGDTPSTAVTPSNNAIPSSSKIALPFSRPSAPRHRSPTSTPLPPISEAGEVAEPLESRQTAVRNTLGTVDTRPQPAFGLLRRYWERAEARQQALSTKPAGKKRAP